MRTLNEHDADSYEEYFEGNPGEVDEGNPNVIFNPETNTWEYISDDDLWQEWINK